MHTKSLFFIRMTQQSRGAVLSTVQVFRYSTPTYQHITLVAHPGWEEEDWDQAIAKAGISDDYSTWDYRVLDDDTEIWNFTIALEDA